MATLIDPPFVPDAGVPPPVDPELAELVRALRRSGRMPADGMTIARLETVLGGTDAAQGYLREWDASGSGWLAFPWVT